MEDGEASGLGLPIHIKYQLILWNIRYYIISVLNMILYTNYIGCLLQPWPIDKDKIVRVCTQNGTRMYAVRYGTVCTVCTVCTVQYVQYVLYSMYLVPSTKYTKYLNILTNMNKYWTSFWSPIGSIWELRTKITQFLKWFSVPRLFGVVKNR